MTAPQLTAVPERQPPPQVPGGARWCFDHERWECTRSRSKGRGTCHGSAIKGTNACKMHAGVATAVAVERGKAVITAWSAIGGTTNVDYRMAVLGVLQMTWLRLAAYSELLRRQVAVEGGEIQLGEDSEPQASGLIGHRISSSPGGLYASSEQVRALVVLEASERDNVVKYAKAAHDMGISERLTSLAERWGDVVASRISLMFDDPRLALSPQQRAVIPDLVSAHLGSIDVEMMETPVPNGNGASKRGVREGGGPSV